jgi:glycerol transport system ATP-binding protein
VESPEHTLVAYFIGSPGMNLLGCTLDKNVARVNGATVVLDENTADLARSAKGKLELGIRPIHLEVSAKEVRNGVRATVKTVEDLGSHKIITFVLADNILHAKLPENVPVPDGSAWLVFPPQWVRLFSDGRLVR